MCLAQGQQRSDAGEARTRGPSVSSQALEFLSDRMNGYTQIDVKKANLLYQRPTNQNESNFSMTTCNQVHDSLLMLLLFLDLKK